MVMNMRLMLIVVEIILYVVVIEVVVEVDELYLVPNSTPIVCGQSDITKIKKLLKVV